MKIKIYLSSFDLQVMLEYKKMFPDSELNVLLSYGTANATYFQMIDTYRDKFSSLVLDSGAFTLNNMGNENSKAVDLPGFKDYCLTFKDKFDFIFNFDSDFTEDGFETNSKNQDYLAKLGIDTVPVVHDYLGANVDEVSEYIQRYDIISLGHSKHKRNKKIVKPIVEKIKNASKKVHILGVSSYEFIKDVPIDFNDSSNWAQAQIFGFMYFWDMENNPNKPEVTLRFRDYEPDRDDTMPYFEDFERRDVVEKYLKDELGISYRALYGNNDTFIRQIINTHYFVKLQDHVRLSHKSLGFDALYPD